MDVFLRMYFKLCCAKVLNYALSTESMKETSAGAVIYRVDEATGRQKYLLLHYGSGHWDFVKGHVEGKETEEETMKREALEESGLAGLGIVPGFREKISYFYKHDGKAVPKDVIFLLAKTKSPEKSVRLSFEHSGFVWLFFDEAVRKVTFQNSKDVLSKADKFLQESDKQKKL